MSNSRKTLVACILLIASVSLIPQGYAKGEPNCPSIHSIKSTTLNSAEGVDDWSYSITGDKYDKYPWKVEMLCDNEKSSDDILKIAQEYLSTLNKRIYKKSVPDDHEAEYFLCFYEFPLRGDDECDNIVLASTPFVK